ncbi:MAG TPA: hypothetical protein VIV40_01885 [Kofleriaceae bacterium]
MKGLVLCIALCACAKESREPTPARPATRPPPTPSRTVHRGPVKTTPRQLFDDFTRPDADGIVLLDKYRDGATFTATIKTVGVEDDGKPVVWIDVDGENLLTLDFDDPVPRDLHAGGQLTVTCKIGGASGALMMVTSCTRG